MDWHTENVVQWLKTIGLSKYAKRFKGYHVSGAVLMQMDETLLDDLEVTNVDDRQKLLQETAKLSPPVNNNPQFLSTEGTKRTYIRNNQVLQTPIITVSDFDDDDYEGEKLNPISDEESTYSSRTSLNGELLNQRILNVAYSGDESTTTDDGSERDFSFKDSDEEHDFDIYDEDKDPGSDFSPTAHASEVATRATQMVALLSRDNLALRQKLESVYTKMNNVQMVECELEGMRAAYDELQISSRRRENLEWSARRRMETEIERLQDNNGQLEDELQKCKDEKQQEKKSIEKCRRDLQLKNNVIRQLIVQSDSFAKTREELENTINQQRRQIEELLKDKEQLHSSLVQSRGRITYLEKELYPNHVIPSRKARAQEVAQSDSATTYTSSTTDDVKTQRRHSNSADEGIAELDGPTTVPGLLELLKEKDERIEELGDQLLRLEQTLQQEGTSRNLAIRAVAMPKEARIAALENSIQESEKIIAECRGQNLKSIEELYVANRRCADLEAIIKSLHSQLSEKSAKIRLLQNNNEELENDDEPKEPEWPLDPAFCRTDFAHIKDLARDSYAESFDSGMSLTNPIDLRNNEPEFRTMDDPDQVSVYYWSV